MATADTDSVQNADRDQPPADAELSSPMEQTTVATTDSGAKVPTDATESNRLIPRPNVRDARQAAEADDQDPSAAYCTACGRHLPHGVPDIGRVVAVDGEIGACARPDCEGVESRSVPFESHTQAALMARRRNGRTTGGQRR